MKEIYFDNASTTFPKPRCVADTIYRFLTEEGSNINRGGYGKAYRTAETVYETRQLLCDMFGGTDCKNVVFTKNATESLNILLKGFCALATMSLYPPWNIMPLCVPLYSSQKMAFLFHGFPAPRTDSCNLIKWKNC
ncbi:hypothetical protein C823_002752 [Eubacterium plexicaudatum ASF492]|uniref:Aminotransferase class V domain-containing protein n=1 Tax=Eubacterium plexicaudatum ASF492 TaxID=1235802 RepID=N2A0R4_9FIRM|nr:hypothetical protein C823_002752 [Eubacterium plexicaudatum ASF492]